MGLGLGLELELGLGVRVGVKTCVIRPDRPYHAPRVSYQCLIPSDMSVAAYGARDGDGWAEL